MGDGWSRRPHAHTLQPRDHMAIETHAKSREAMSSGRMGMGRGLDGRGSCGLMEDSQYPAQGKKGGELWMAGAGEMVLKTTWR